MHNIIHPSAIIEEGAKIGKNNYIGPFCIINKDAVLGNNNYLKSHVVINDYCHIGDNNRFFPFSSIGEVTQDKKYDGSISFTNIGNNNVFRECTTLNRGTSKNSTTEIGDNCLFMANSHIAHDCIVGNNVILANSVALAGHVVIEDFVIIGGLTGIHQHTRIGKHAMIGGLSKVVADVIPFGLVIGENAHLAGLNIVGMKRRDFSKKTMSELREAYEIIFNFTTDKNFAERISQVKEEYANSSEVMAIINFISQDSSRAICKPLE